MKFSVITPEYNQLGYLDRVKEAWDGQTFKDFEWIVSSDGEDLMVAEWCEKNGVKHIWHAKDGRNYSKTVNDGARDALGEYIVVVNADSYPEADFLEKLSLAVDENRVISTIRINVDQEGKVVSPDWRIDRVIFDTEQDVIEIVYPRAWAYMTGNGMCIGRKQFLDMGGYCEEYHGGREDWDLFLHAEVGGMKMAWAPKAKINHFYHGEWVDTQENIDVWNRRVTILEEAKMAKRDRIEEKKEQIMDIARAEEKEKERQKHLREIEANDRKMEKEDSV